MRGLRTVDQRVVMSVVWKASMTEYLLVVTWVVSLVASKAAQMAEEKAARWV